MSAQVPPRNAGTQHASLLMPLLAVSVLGFSGASHVSNTFLPGDAMSLADTHLRQTDYRPEMFAPRFTPIWATVLCTQYRRVALCEGRIHGMTRPDERTISAYRRCVRGYDQLAALAPCAVFSRQRLPRYIQEPLL